MEEPLLAAVVTNEAEPSVANESFDRAAWHSSLLGAVAQGAQSISVPVCAHRFAEEIRLSWKTVQVYDRNRYGDCTKLVQGFGSAPGGRLPLSRAA